MERGRGLTWEFGEGVVDVCHICTHISGFVSQANYQHRLVIFPARRGQSLCRYIRGKESKNDRFWSLYKVGQTLDCVKWWDIVQRRRLTCVVVLAMMDLQQNILSGKISDTIYEVISSTYFTSTSPSALRLQDALRKKVIMTYAGLGAWHGVDLARRMARNSCGAESHSNAWGAWTQG